MKEKAGLGDLDSYNQRFCRFYCIKCGRQIFACPSTSLFPMGIRKQNLFLGNRLLLTMLRMIDPENTNIQEEGSSLLESQLSTEFCKFSYLIADKLQFVKLEYYGTSK